MTTQLIFPQKHEAAPPEIRMSVLERDKFTCQNCKIESDAKVLIVHHKIPVRKGGSHDMSNLITLCRKCHRIVEPAHSLNYAWNVGKTTIQIDVTTREALCKMGMKWESYEDIIKRLMEAYKK